MNKVELEIKNKEKIEKWKIEYEQLNLRSRWYTNQSWAIPIAFFTLIGAGFDKIIKLDYPYKSLVFFILCLFSLTLFVHLTSIKYYEQRAVSRMRELEDKPFSTGGSIWYLSFISYIKFLFYFIGIVFLIIAIYYFEYIGEESKIMLGISSCIILSIFYLRVLLDNKDRMDKLYRERKL